MANPYASLFTHAGTKAFFGAGIISRGYMCMCGIGIITMISLTTNNYRLAGLVSAVYVVTAALASPQISRLADRFGQSKIVPPFVLICSLGILSMLIVAATELPQWLYFVSAFFAGWVPSMPALIRARWINIYRGTPELQTAFAMESVVDELSFVIGPAISVLLCSTLFPEAGPLAGVALLVVGSALFVSQRATEPPSGAAEDAAAGKPVLSIPSIWALMAILATLGIMAGCIDIASVAFTQEQGQPKLSAAIISLYALGSAIAGFIYGGIKLRSTLPKQLLYASAVTTVCSLGMLGVYITNNIGVLGLGVLILGITFSPCMIICMSLAEKISPSAQVTEAMSWMITGMNIGTAAGGAIAGWIIDANTGHTSTAFLLVTFGALLMFAITAASVRRVRDDRKSEAARSGA